MKISKFDCYKNFKCIASKCPDTCCAGWNVVFDKNSAKKYDAIKGDFGTKLKDNIDFDGKQYTAKMLCDRCAFLNDENLCEIYINLGENALSEICTNHPRFINDFGGSQEVTFSLSCPESVRLLLLAKNMNIVTNDANIPITPNDIDADLYFYLKNARQKIFDTLNNNFSLKTLSSIYRYCELLQNNIKNRAYIDCEIPLDADFNIDVEKFSKILSAYKNADFTRDKLKNAFIVASKQIKKHNVLDCIENSIKTTPDIYYKLTCVYMFRYFLTAVFDEDLIEKIKFIITSIFIFAYISAIDEFKSFEGIEELIRLYTRDIIHSEENVNLINKTLKKINF